MTITVYHVHFRSIKVNCPFTATQLLSYYTMLYLIQGNIIRLKTWIAIVPRLNQQAIES